MFGNELGMRRHLIRGARDDVSQASEVSAYNIAVLGVHNRMIILGCYPLTEHDS